MVAQEHLHLRGEGELAPSTPGLGELGELRVGPGWRQQVRSQRGTALLALLPVLKHRVTSGMRVKHNITNALG